MTAAQPAAHAPLHDVAVIVIGRNEGERLRRCLGSILAHCPHAVYVDSGSTDGSLEMALAQGAHCIPLDMSQPFTAARARNVGLKVALEDSGLKFIQFVDGDCEIEPGWLAAARAYLDAHPEVGVAFGRRKERYPDRSVYNTICDIEWQVPAGKALYCGGDAMFRAEALREVRGYRDSLIAGEEPELCVRLRQKNWSVMCLDLPMTSHDAAMTRFAQWWRRSMRCGYAFAEGAYLHGAPPERHWVKEARRAWVWGAAIPVTIFCVAPLNAPLALLLSLTYPAQIARLYLRRRRTTPSPLLISAFQVFGKLPEAVGQLKFRWNNLLKRQARLIEYK
jgi:glycosyltransferase involved in cell wall biosynthesis